MAVRGSPSARGSTIPTVPPQNNDIHDCPNGLYLDADGYGLLLTAADINDYTLATQDAALPSGNNTSDNAFLVDIDGADDGPATLEDNDWRLSSSSPDDVSFGGLNGVHSNAGWGFSTDLGGALRSPLDDSSELGWSMGAYEYAAPGAAPPGGSILRTLSQSSAMTTAPATPVPPLPVPLRSH